MVSTGGRPIKIAEIFRRKSLTRLGSHGAGGSVRVVPLRCLLLHAGPAAVLVVFRRLFSSPTTATTTFTPSISFTGGDTFAVGRAGQLGRHRAADRRRRRRTSRRRRRGGRRIRAWRRFRHGLGHGDGARIHDHWPADQRPSALVVSVVPGQELAACRRADGPDRADKRADGVGVDEAGSRS